VSRGPELVSASIPSSSNTLVLTFSNATLVVHEGILVLDKGGCEAGKNSAFVQKVGKTLMPLSYSIERAKVSVDCKPADCVVWVNSDVAICFVYEPPPIEIPRQ
jgi:hypothetical protein